MDALLTAIETLPAAEALRFSRWGYAAVNTMHVLGIALLVGGVVPLSLRLFGAWPKIMATDFVRPLAATAATGLALAILTGLCLFATRAGNYAGNPAFQMKLMLLIVAIGSTAIAGLRHGWDMQGASSMARRGHALVSIMCWIGALVSGRLIAFLGD